MVNERKLILMLDDSEVVLDLARRHLQQAGFDVRTALSLSEFNELRLDCRPDLILLDVQMPELDGDDLGVILRNTRGPKTPIMLFSTLENRDLERRTREAGLDGFVSKNEGLEALVAGVRRLLG